jgi:aldose 1-epimerase
MQVPFFVSNNDGLFMDNFETSKNSHQNPEVFELSFSPSAHDQTHADQASIKIKLTDFGASWISCQVPVNASLNSAYQEVLSTCYDASIYPTHDGIRSVYLGATVGRWANRIANGSVQTPTGLLQLQKARHQQHLLHGGEKGFDQHYWQVKSKTASSICFELWSPHLDQGFPGNLKVQTQYELIGPMSLKISYEAIADQDTPLSLTNHAYFNLLGPQLAELNSDLPAAFQHQLKINSDWVCPVNDELIPENHQDLLLVAGSYFDYREFKNLTTPGLDQGFLLQPNTTQDQPLAVALRLNPNCSTSTLQMNISTSLPAVQIYTGEALAGIPKADGSHSFLKAFDGVAIEPGFLPDSPNQPQWPQPSCILKAGQVWKHWIVYEWQNQ